MGSRNGTNPYQRVAIWPSFQLEDELARINPELQFVAGVDEVGAGALAGPLVAGAVMLEIRRTDWYRELDDSKQLSRQARERLDKLVRKQAVAYGIGSVAVHELDAWGMTKARAEAMRRALSHMVSRLQTYPVVDLRFGVIVDDKSLRQQDVANGRPALYTNGADSKSLSVAAASIVAKVWRDGELRKLATSVPGYGFETNVGYSTLEHLRALRTLGVTTAHRRTFAPVKRAVAAAAAR